MAILKPSTVEQFVADGYVVTDDLLTPAEIDAFARLVPPRLTGRIPPRPC